MPMTRIDRDALLEGLTEPQRQAVEHLEGPLLVLAAAGSGKTRVITRRIANLIASGAPPWSILALTFTNKAAGEMRERVFTLLENDPRLTRGLTVTTFHALCARLLRRYAGQADLGVKADFTIYPSGDQASLMKRVIGDLNLSTSNFPPRSVLSTISNAKNELLDASAYAARAGDFYTKQVSKIYEAYERGLRAANAVDFDDLLLLTARMLREDAEVRRQVQDRWRYLLIDEYQDTNQAQFTIASLIAGEGREIPGMPGETEGPNICVVGDPDQCLPEGTMIETPTGPRPVEELAQGDEVVSGIGWGAVGSQSVDAIAAQGFEGDLVIVHTAGGIGARFTPNHICFARLRPVENLHYTYLMFKRGVGYRIGTTRGVRTSKDGEVISGLQVRTNQEVADAVWILRTCSTSAEARYYEHLYSVKYGIPTIVFFVRGRRMDMTQELIDRLYAEVDTADAADRLIDDLGLDRRYPHHRPAGVTRLGVDSMILRRHVLFTAFGGPRRVRDDAWHEHRVQIVTTDPEMRARAEGRFRVRDGQRGTWRIETSRKHLADAEALARDIATLADDACVVPRARLTPDKAFQAMPAAHLQPGMAIPVLRGGEVVEDVIEGVGREPYCGRVYDLSVPETRNFSAGGVIVHNSIYGWRGADISNILDFEEHYPAAQVIRLGENFRSVAPILAVADTLIRNNKRRKHKDLFTSREGGDDVLVEICLDEHHEAERAADWFQRLHDDPDEPMAWRDMAVFYRTNALSRVMEDTLRGRGIPYVIARGTAFYEREEVRNAIAYLRVIANPADEVSLERVVNTPSRGIGKQSLTQLGHWAQVEGIGLFEAMRRCREHTSLTSRAHNSMERFVALIDSLSGSGTFMGAELTGSLADLVERVIKESGLEAMYAKQAQASKSETDEQRLDNLAEVVSSAAEFERQYEPEADPAAFPGADVLESGGRADVPPLLAMLRGYLESVSLVADADKVDPAQGAVTLMTLHASKGLEFGGVAMLGLEEGLLPHSRAQTDENELEEERRLCFVGITRAMRHLRISCASSRAVRGFAERTISSRFLEELGTEHVRFRDLSDIDEGVRAFRSTTAAPQGVGAIEELKPPMPPRASMGAASMVREFPPGTMVRHPQFGIGRVLEVSGGSLARAKVEFRDAGVKTLILEYARLRKLEG